MKVTSEPRGEVEFSGSDFRAVDTQEMVFAEVPTELDVAADIGRVVQPSGKLQCKIVVKTRWRESVLS